MGLQAKRELLVQVACRYMEAGPAHKTIILDEFVAATGYARKYAIRLLAKPAPPSLVVCRPRQRRYGPVVQEALATCWAAANAVCAKRLVPFLPELVEALERHGHLALSAEDRAQLLGISAATADRLLRPLREQGRVHGVSTTKPGALIKRQIPVRTFQDWDDARPGCLVGYDRFEGEAAYRQLAELYRAVRLSVNFFPPSMKLATKRRAGSVVQRTYAPAKTPFRRLVESGVLPDDHQARLTAVAVALDPVPLLRQVQLLQDALWRHVVFRTPAPQPLSGSDAPELRRFVVERERAGATPGPAHPRKYRRTEKSSGPRWWRTRADPFADVWAEIVAWLEVEPTRTGTSLFADLQQRYPGRFADGRCRTVHRRMHEWRAQRILAFDEQWLQDDVLLAQRLPRPLRVRPLDESSQPVLVSAR